MSFVKSLDEIEKSRKEKFDFYSAEFLNVFWETKPEIVERLLPPPLKPGKRPLAHGFVANYPKTNFGLPYLESAIFLRAEYNGVEGNYCLAMHLDGPGKDLGMAGGREQFGFPKKLAKIHFSRDGKEVEGWSERHETRNIEIRAKLTGKFNDMEAPKILIETGMIQSGKMKNPVAVNYNFKYFLAPEGEGFDYYPRLIREDTVLRPKTMEMGEAELVLKSSIHDPWAEVEILRVLGVLYQKGDNSMLQASVVAEVNPEEFLPYAFLKWDWF